MPFEFLEEEATADIAFRATGETLEEMFRSAGDAVMNVMIEDLDSIQPKETRTYTASHAELDMLLFDFLQEIIYHKDHEQLLVRPQSISIKEGYTLEATFNGERLDPVRHEQRVDVKAVTLHKFHVEKSPQGWSAFVILDI